VLLAQRDQAERARDLDEGEDDDGAEAPAKAPQDITVKRQGHEHERRERGARGDDRPRRHAVVEADLDEEVRRAPERAEREEQSDGAARHPIEIRRRRPSRPIEAPWPDDKGGLWRYCAAMSQENVEFVRRLMRAFDDGDVEALVEECDPEVEWEDQSSPVRRWSGLADAARSSRRPLRPAKLRACARWRDSSRAAPRRAEAARAARPRPPGWGRTRRGRAARRGPRARTASRTARWIGT
jgi:hypothetical protein